MDTLAQDIAQRAYALEPDGLNAALRQLGLPGWARTLENLSFQGWDTGGGCMMLVAELPGTGGHQVGITDGEADFPRDAENFWVGILDPDGDELHFMFVKGGKLQS
ncbi:hypothetical protein V3W47_08735 [Deinococcus sp. YIM 134068]|uniref:hypothetical protein n=1 Tax=Deinococcus lichenicola TaxID=3118910 RepID=UPI002F91EE93